MYGCLWLYHYKGMLYISISCSNHELCICMCDTTFMIGADVIIHNLCWISGRAWYNCRGHDPWFTNYSKWLYCWAGIFFRTHCMVCLVLFSFHGTHPYCYYHVPFLHSSPQIWAVVRTLNLTPGSLTHFYVKYVREVVSKIHWIAEWHTVIGSCTLSASWAPNHGLYSFNGYLSEINMP